jgi:hypothetical protein
MLLEVGVFHNAMRTKNLKIKMKLYFKSQGSVVGIEAGYGLNDRMDGVLVPVEPSIFTFYIVQTGSGGPSNLLFYGYRGLFHRG